MAKPEKIGRGVGYGVTIDEIGEHPAMYYAEFYENKWHIEPDGIVKVMYWRKVHDIHNRIEICPNCDRKRIPENDDSKLTFCSEECLFSYRQECMACGRDIGISNSFCSHECINEFDGHLR